MAQIALNASATLISFNGMLSLSLRDPINHKTNKNPKRWHEVVDPFVVLLYYSLRWAKWSCFPAFVTTENREIINPRGEEHLYLWLGIFQVEQRKGLSYFLILWGSPGQTYRPSQAAEIKDLDRLLRMDQGEAKLLPEYPMVKLPRCLMHCQNTWRFGF